MAKMSLVRALFAKRRMKKESAKMKRYDKHVKAAGVKHAMTYAQWQKEGESHLYYKVPRLRRKSIEARLREAGVSGEDIQKLKSKKFK